MILSFSVQRIPSQPQFATSIMRPQQVKVTGGPSLISSRHKGTVAAGIGGEVLDETPLDKPKPKPNLERFKMLWDAAKIPGPARYITPDQWTRPWARLVDTTTIKATVSPPGPRQPPRPPLQKRPTPTEELNIEFKSMDSARVLPPGFVAHGEPLIPLPGKSLGEAKDFGGKRKSASVAGEAMAEQAEVTQNPRLFEVARSLKR